MIKYHVYFSEKNSFFVLVKFMLHLVELIFQQENSKHFTLNLKSNEII